MDRPAEVLIDLGPMDPGVDQREPVAGPVRASVRWRRWAVAAVAVLPGISLGGAAGPVAPALEELWTVLDGGQFEVLSQSGYAVDEHRLYLASPGRLVAYRLADGRVEWQAGLPASASDYLSVTLVAGIPVVMISGATTQTVAYQADSGRERWRLPGAPSGKIGEWLTILTRTVDRADRFELGVAAVDPDTGSVVGQVRLDETEEHWQVWQPPAGGAQLLTLRRDGRLSRYDLATGELVETVATPHAEAPDSTTNSLEIVEGVLVVGDQASDPPAVAGYHPATLAHRWTLSRVSWPSSCARSVCVESQAGGGGTSGLRAVDPMTGGTRWSIDCAGDGADGCSVWVQELADRLWVERVRWWEEGDREQVSSWIADSGTGEPLTGTTSWRLWSGVEEPGLLLSRDEAWQSPDQPSRLWWARSDIEPLRPVVLGAVVADQCDPRYPYLVCWTDGEGLAVWQVGS